MKYIKKPSNQFLKEYKLPLGASFAFVIVVIALLFSRTVNRIALTDVLGKNSNNNYSELLSSDNKDNFRKNESIGESATPDSTTPSPTTKPSFTVSPNPTPPPVQTDPGQPTPPPTPSPFTASILGFGLYKTEYEYCSPDYGGAGTPYKCFKKYFYKGRIKTVNGPGTVKYEWEGNFDDINSSDSFSVTSSEAYTDVSNEFKLSCSLAGQQIKIRLKTIEPNISEAPWQGQMHDCTT